MECKNMSSNVFCFEDLYNLVFVECGGNIDTSFPLSFVYFLEDMAHEDDNITFQGARKFKYETSIKHYLFH